MPPRKVKDNKPIVELPELVSSENARFSLKKPEADVISLDDAAAQENIAEGVNTSVL